MSKERKNIKGQSAICEGMEKYKKIQKYKVYFLHFYKTNTEKFKEIQNKYECNFSKIPNTKKKRTKKFKNTKYKKKIRTQNFKIQNTKKNTSSKMSQRANPMFILKS